MGYICQTYLRLNNFTQCYTINITQSNLLYLAFFEGLFSVCNSSIMNKL